MTNVCIHVLHSDGKEQFHHAVKYIPRKYDRFSLASGGETYEVDYTLYNLFTSPDEIEIYCHEIN